MRKNLKADKSTTFAKAEADNRLGGNYNKAESHSQLPLKADKSTADTKTTETDTQLKVKHHLYQNRDRYIIIKLIE